MFRYRSLDDKMMSDRKAELERKKAKLQAIREEKERRRREKEQKDVRDERICNRDTLDTARFTHSMHRIENRDNETIRFWITGRGSDCPCCWYGQRSTQGVRRNAVLVGCSTSVRYVITCALVSVLYNSIF